MNVLISSIYSLEPVMKGIRHVSPEKIVFIHEPDPGEELEKNMQLLRDTIGKVTEIEVEHTDLYDVVEAARTAVEIIEREAARGNTIYINISSGRKPLALGILFGAYARNTLVKEVDYSPEEELEVMSLPLLSFGLSDTKRRILELIEAGMTDIPEIGEKTGISRGMAYNHVRELRDQGFIHEKEMRLTTSGKLAIL